MGLQEGIEVFGRDDRDVCVFGGEAAGETGLQQRRRAVQIDVEPDIANMGLPVIDKDERPRP